MKSWLVVGVREARAVVSVGAWSWKCLDVRASPADIHDTGHVAQVSVRHAQGGPLPVSPPRQELCAQRVSRGDWKCVLENTLILGLFRVT